MLQKENWAQRVQARLKLGIHLNIHLLGKLRSSALRPTDRLIDDRPTDLSTSANCPSSSHL